MHLRLKRSRYSWVPGSSVLHIWWKKQQNIASFWPKNICEHLMDNDINQFFLQKCSVLYFVMDRRFTAGKCRWKYFSANPICQPLWATQWAHRFKTYPFQSFVLFSNKKTCKRSKYKQGNPRFKRDVRWWCKQLTLCSNFYQLYRKKYHKQLTLVRCGSKRIWLYVKRTSRHAKFKQFLNQLARNFYE